MFIGIGGKQIPARTGVAHVTGNGDVACKPGIQGQVVSIQINGCVKSDIPGPRPGDNLRVAADYHIILECDVTAAGGQIGCWHTRSDNNGVGSIDVNSAGNRLRFDIAGHDDVFICNCGGLSIQGNISIGLDLVVGPVRIYDNTVTCAGGTKIIRTGDGDILTRIQLARSTDVNAARISPSRIITVGNNADIRCGPGCLDQLVDGDVTRSGD